jgi:hypothetical protein
MDHRCPDTGANWLPYRGETLNDWFCAPFCSIGDAFGAFSSGWMYPRGSCAPEFTYVISLWHFRRYALKEQRNALATAEQRNALAAAPHPQHPQWQARVADLVNSDDDSDYLLLRCFRARR